MRIEAYLYISKYFRCVLVDLNLKFRGEVDAESRTVLDKSANNELMCDPSGGTIVCVCGAAIDLKKLVELGREGKVEYEQLRECGR